MPSVVKVTSAKMLKLSNPVNLIRSTAFVFVPNSVDSSVQGA